MCLSWIVKPVAWSQCMGSALTGKRNQRDLMSLLSFFFVSKRVLVLNFRTFIWKCVWWNMQMKCYAARLVPAPSFEQMNHCFMNIQCWCWTNWYVHRHWRHVRRCWSQEERVHSELCSSDAEMSSSYGAKGGRETSICYQRVSAGFWFGARGIVSVVFFWIVLSRGIEPFMWHLARAVTWHKELA